MSPALIEAFDPPVQLGSLGVGHRTSLWSRRSQGCYMSLGRCLIFLTLSAILSHCGVAAKINARNKMEVSKAAYKDCKDCLARNPRNVPACEASRLSYETDMKPYRAASAGIQPGRNDTINMSSTQEA